MTVRKVIIDTDPGCDDMLAILLMCAASSIDISAVTTVAGNSTLQNVTNNAHYILNLAGRPDIPLYSGADRPLQREPTLAKVHGTSGLGDIEVTEKIALDNTAVDNLLRLVRTNPNEISLLILGPQTNIAQAIIREPSTMQLMKEFVIMGGAFDVPGNTNRVAEFNMSVDPEAAAIVADFPVRKTYVPLDICNQIQVPIAEFQQIRDISLQTSLTSMLAPYIRNLQESELKTRGALMYDALAAYYLLKPEVCTVREEAFVVETAGTHTYGMTLIDKRPFSPKRPPNATIVTSIPQQQFIEDFFNLLNGV